MNIPRARIINQTLAERLASEAATGKFELVYLAKKHQLVIEDGLGWLAKIHLPWTLDWLSSGGFKEKADSHFSLVLIRAGQAVTGYFHRGELIDHKVFRAYMVRQKQGVSQIKHLKTKGKSRAGSRIRLTESERFFEEINERLNSYSERFPIDLWGISCAKTMWPFYFDSAVSPPFSKKDKNLVELPVHISQASFEELEQLGQLLSKFHLVLSKRGEELFGTYEWRNSQVDESDNW